jgi:hypothetical protein
MPAKKISLILIGFLLLMSSLVSAGTINWNNHAGGPWETPANWTPISVPGASDEVVIDSAEACTITVNSVNAIKSLTLTGAAQLWQYSGKITVSSHPYTGWRFAVVGDTRSPTLDILKEMVPFMVNDGVKFVLFPGDLVDTTAGTTSNQLLDMLNDWKSAVAPLYNANIGVYPIRGNHEADVTDGASAWNTAFSGSYVLPGNGPSGEINMTYSFVYNNALFIGLDEYVTSYHVNQSWLDQQLAANTARPHLFVFGHIPAFVANHSPSLDAYPGARNTFWASILTGGARTYFCGHDHFFDVARIDDGDGNADNDLFQIITGTGGAPFHDAYAYNGSNSPYAPVGLTHIKAYGYLLVEVSGETARDLMATMTFKKRSTSVSGVTYVPDYTWNYTANGKASQ